MHKCTSTHAAQLPCAHAALLFPFSFLAPFSFLLSISFFLSFFICPVFTSLLSLFVPLSLRNYVFCQLRGIPHSHFSSFLSFFFSFSLLLLYQALFFWDSSLSLFPFPFLSVSIRFNASAYCEFRRKQIAAIFRLISSRQRLPLSIAHPTIHPSIPISPRVISPS